MYSSSMNVALLLVAAVTATSPLASPDTPGAHPGLAAYTASQRVQKELHELNKTLNNRLIKPSPFASPCFVDFNSSECQAIRQGYRDGLYRTNHPSAYVQVQWETCQTTEERCLLDSVDPHNVTPTIGRNCTHGSVSDYLVDVRSASDVAAALKFSQHTKVPLVIKNTGHDYLGRSSAAGALALWTHHLKDISYTPKFVPVGCSFTKSQPGVTIGAGVQWGEVYAFAEKNNITVVGGADIAVGSAGGWLQGGGHGGLSNTMGLGVDRVLQYKVVTPDGNHRIVNDCQNHDLFFALRGGGGGTFGVVLEATVLASPVVKVQTFILSFPTPNVTRTTEIWSILAQNGLRWADDGWGGYSNAGAVILINPVLSPQDAARSLAPLIEYGKGVKAETVESVLLVTEFPTFGAFINLFTSRFVASAGKPLALASRLISKNNFKTPQRQEELVSALLAADATTPGLIILISAPASVPSKGKTSVTEAWRNSLYHITVVSAWNWNSTKDEIAAHYVKASKSIDNLRRITPNAAYLNEADVYEPNHEGKSFKLGQFIGVASNQLLLQNRSGESTTRDYLKSKRNTTPITYLTAGIVSAGIRHQVGSSVTCPTHCKADESLNVVIPM